jgi:hypothetical protein
MQIYTVRHHIDNVGLAPFAAATKHFPYLVAFNGFHRKLPMFCLHRLVRRDGGVQAAKWQAVLRTTPHAFKLLLIHPIDKFLIGSNAQRGWCC